MKIKDKNKKLGRALFIGPAVVDGKSPGSEVVPGFKPVT